MHREPMGYDLFGDPYFEDDVAVPEPEQLREFTPQTLPKCFRTWQQIRDVGLESVGPPVGLLSWTPSGACAPKTAKVYDISKARKAGPREPDLFELFEEAEEQEPLAAAGGVGRVHPVISQGVLALAAWSEWVPLIGAEVPRLPGVYLARRGQSGPIVYVGMSGERQGEGLRGRIRRYTSGKALASGLGEAVFDRALADLDWVRERLAEVESGQPMRATGWGKAALTWADLHVCWAITADGEAARVLEEQVLSLESVDWWNRAR